MSDQVTAEKKPNAVKRAQAFLAAYKHTASITRAAQAAGIERQMHYRWLRDYPKYREAFLEAQRIAMQTLEDEAVRRAHEGVEKPVVYQGQIQYKRAADEDGNIKVTDEPVIIREYDSQLLMFLLKGGMPEKYRERGQIELSGPAGGPITIEQKKLQLLTDDELAALTSIAKKLAAPAPARSGEDEESQE